MPETGFRFTNRFLDALNHIADLTDDDVRDYEQGACFFCGTEIVLGRVKGVGGRVKSRPHAADCAYVAIKEARYTC